MKNVFEDNVYYGDTDAYGVVWHGAYLRWMEKGRVLLCEEIGVDFNDLKENKDVLLPVSSLNIRYKSSAKIGEKISVKTTISRITPISVTFHQVISNSETGQVHTDAELVGVAVNKEGKLYRRFPEVLKEIFTEDVICND
ncbi:acyl-CoA thioesterase [bacterium]|nr:acyl-CoA thioesterase [bacterium]